MEGPRALPVHPALLPCGIQGRCGGSWRARRRQARVRVRKAKFRVVGIRGRARLPWAAQRESLIRTARSGFSCRGWWHAEQMSDSVYGWRFRILAALGFEGEEGWRVA